MLDDLQTLSVDAVAGILQLHENSVRDLIRRGEIPSLRVGRRVLVRRADLRDFIDGRVETGTPARSEHQWHAVGGAR